jgi:hypothetical protein
MKTIIALAVLFNISAVSAQDFAPKYYSAHFDITKVSPMCPATIPTGAQCMAFGSIVEISAHIGCIDKVVYKNIQVVRNNGTIEIHAVSVIKKDPKADVVRCYRANTIKEIVPVHDMGPVTIVNDIVEF